MADFFIKRGDLLPKIRSTLKNSSGAPLRLTGATVNLRMSSIGMTPAVSFERPATVIDEVAGIVEYAWQAGDTAVVGNYQSEWAITFPEGVMTVPNFKFITVQIRDSLA